MILSGATARLLGLICLILFPLPLLPLWTDFLAGQPTHPWAETCAAFALLGLTLTWVGRSRHISEVGPLDGAVITTGSWLVLALAAGWGIHRAIPGSTWIEGIFEATSGLTTTGASAFGEHIPFAALTDGVLLWRSICCAVGGIGIVVMTLALLPMLGGSGYQLFRSEVSGLALDRLTPRLADTVRLLAAANLAMIGILTIALHLCGVPWFHAVCHAMATIATAGFSSYANSVDAIPATGQWVLVAGMVTGGLNMALLITAARTRRPGMLWSSEETRFYLLVMAVLSAAVVAVLLFTGHPYGDDWRTTIRHGLFAVVSLGTSTGFTLGYEPDPRSWNGWHPAAQFLLVAVTLGVACVGSTGGGVKAMRLLLALKVAKRTVRQFREPALLSPITLDRRPLSDRTVLGALILLGIFALAWAAGTLALLIAAPLDLLTAATASLSSLSNTGPGLGAVGPEHSFVAVGQPGLVICSVLMLLGRVEFVAILALLARSR